MSEETRTNEAKAALVAEITATMAELGIPAAQPAPATIPAPEEPKPKHQRRQQRTLNVRYDERHYPREALEKLDGLRREVTALNRALYLANKHIRSQRHDVRLYERVMRLKTEAFHNGASRAVAMLERQRQQEGLIQHEAPAAQAVT